jgi:hypothetical protein
VLGNAIHDSPPAGSSGPSPGTLNRAASSSAQEVPESALKRHLQQILSLRPVLPGQHQRDPQQAAGTSANEVLE